MANRVRFVDNVSVSAFGNTGGDGSSVSSSYAETASFAQSGDGIFSGSFSGSFQGDGSSLTGVTGEWDGSHLGNASITGSLTLSGSYPGTALTVETYQGTLEFEPAPSRTNENVKLLITGKGSGATDISLYKQGASALSTVVGTGAVGFFYSASSVDFVPYTNPQTATSYSYTSTILPLSIKSSGNVGIGYVANTSDVPTKLSVSGSIFSTNNISASNGIYSSASIKAETIFRLGDDAFFRASPALLHLGLGSSTCGAISTERDCIQFRTSTATGFGGIIPLEIHDNYIELNSPVTASGNVSSSAASTASFGTYLGDGSQLSGISTTPFPFSGSAVITGSLVVSGSSKPLEVIGSGSTVFSVVGSLGELFAIDDQLSGSLLVVNDSSGLPQFEVFSDGRTLIGASPRSLYTTATISSTTAATSQSIYSLSTSSYDGVFFDYTVTSASNARAGNIMSIWNGGSIVYTENTTTDIGSTTGVNFDVIISQSQAQLISVTDTAGWKIKTTIRSI